MAASARSAAGSSSWRPPCAAAAVALVAFWNALEGDFVFDDAYAIVHNQDVHPSTHWSELWRNDFWGFRISSSASHKSYRPVTIWTFRAQVLLSGGRLDAGTAASMHACNVLLHAVTSAMFALVCGELLGLGTAPACVASVAFAAHPVHVEAVASLVGRAELLAGSLQLLCLLAVARGRALGVSVALGVLALLCKETAVAALPLAAAWEGLALAGVVAAGPGAVGTPAGGHEGPAPAHARRLAWLLAATVLLVVARLAWQRGPPFLHPEANPGAFASYRTSRILTLHYYLHRHLRLLVLPAPLCCDWSHSSIPLVQSFADERVWISLLSIYGPLATAVVAAASSVLRRARKASLVASCAAGLWEKWKLALALLMLALPLLPSTNLVFPVGFTVAERVLYLPSMGFCALAGLLFSAAWGDDDLGSRTRPTFRRGAAVAVAAAAVMLGVEQCRAHSLHWRSAEALYRHGVAVNPRNEKLHDLLATRLHNSGGDPHAVEWHAREALSINPSYWHAHATLGQVLSARGDARGAAESYGRAVALAEAQGLGSMADVPKVRLNLAMMLQTTAPSDADAHFRRALDDGLGDLQATAALVHGAFLESDGRLVEAVGAYRKAMDSSGLEACADAAHLRLGTAIAKALRLAEAEGSAQASAGDARHARRDDGGSSGNLAQRTVSLEQSGSAASGQCFAADTRFSRLRHSDWFVRCQADRLMLSELGLVVLDGSEGGAPPSRVWRWLRCSPLWALEAVAAARQALASAGPVRPGGGSGLSAAALSAHPAAPSKAEAFQHLRAGLLLGASAQTSALDPQGHKRAEAIAVLGSLMSFAGREAARAVLAQLHPAGPAAALRSAAKQCVEVRDLAVAYEALKAAATLEDSAEVQLELAQVLEQAGDARAAHHRGRARELAKQRRRTGAMDKEATRQGKRQRGS